MRATFHKQERLSSRADIQQLFAGGNSFHAAPFKIVWKNYPSGSTRAYAQIVISVPKSNFKNAVARNRIKRKCREAYRKNKLILLSVVSKKNVQCRLMLIYTAKLELPFAGIQSKIILILQRLASENEKNP